MADHDPWPAEDGNGLEIREMELEDIAPVFALGEHLFTAARWPTLYRTWDEYELLNLFASDGETCLVAELEGRIVGFALGSLLEKRKGPWTYGYLAWLGVEPELGRRGIGHQLVEELRERFIDMGARMLLVDTEADNDAALRLFRKLGFGHPRAHVYMTMNLTKERDYLRRRRRRTRGDRRRGGHTPTSSNGGQDGG